MSTVMMQQNITDRSGNEDDTSVPTSTIDMPFFSYWRNSLSFSSLKKALRLLEVEKIFSTPLVVV